MMGHKYDSYSISDTQSAFNALDGVILAFRNVISSFTGISTLFKLAVQEYSDLNPSTNSLGIFQDVHKIMSEVTINYKLIIEASRKYLMLPSASPSDPVIYSFKQLIEVLNVETSVLDATITSLEKMLEGQKTSKNTIFAVWTSYYNSLMLIIAAVNTACVFLIENTGDTISPAERENAIEVWHKKRR